MSFATVELKSENEQKHVGTGERAKWRNLCFSLFFSLSTFSRVAHMQPHSKHNAVVFYPLRTVEFSIRSKRDHLLK